MESPNFDKLLETIRQIVNQAIDRDVMLKAICEALAEAVPHYNWVGFYLVDPDNKRELQLGPFVGESTEHTHIAFGKGVCGQAADTEMTFVIQDISKETNYLSCSPTVKSEIVVPIFKGGEVAGELDIDSHALAPFTEADRTFLESVCTILGSQM